MSFLAPTYTGAMNAGIDLISCTIIDNATNLSVAFGGRRSDFNVSSKDELITGTGADNYGKVDHRFIPGGYTGTITIERYNGALIAVKKFIDSTFYGGGGQKFYTITKTVVNSDNSTDKDVFTYCVLSINEGQWRRVGAVMQTITFHAQEML